MQFTSSGKLVESLESAPQTRDPKEHLIKGLLRFDQRFEDKDSAGSEKIQENIVMQSPEGISQNSFIVRPRTKITQEEKRERAKLRLRAWRERKRQLRSSPVAMPADPSGSVFGPGEESAYCFEA